MIRLALSIAGTAALAGGLAAVPSSATAQSETLGQVIVYGNDPCPRTTDDEIVVCVRRPEKDRYRIHEDLRSSGARQQRESWTKQSRAIMSAGNTGINSCSAVGPAGHTGCLIQEIENNKAAVQEGQQAETAPE